MFMHEQTLSKMEFSMWEPCARALRMRALLALFTERPRLLMGSRESTMFMFLIANAFPAPCCTRGLYISNMAFSTSPLSSVPPSAPATGSTASMKGQFDP